jgi:hypothetical protein
MACGLRGRRAGRPLDRARRRAAEGRWVARAAWWCPRTECLGLASQPSVAKSPGTLQRSKKFASTALPARTATRCWWGDLAVRSAERDSSPQRWDDLAVRSAERDGSPQRARRGAMAVFSVEHDGIPRLARPDHADAAPSLSELSGGAAGALAAVAAALNGGRLLHAAAPRDIAEALSIFRESELAEQRRRPLLFALALLHPFVGATRRSKRFARPDLLPAPGQEMRLHDVAFEGGRPASSRPAGTAGHPRPSPRAEGGATCCAKRTRRTRRCSPRSAASTGCADASSRRPRLTRGAGRRAAPARTTCCTKRAAAAPT